MPIYENANHDAKVERDLATDGGVDRSDGGIEHREWPEAVNGYEKHPSPEIWNGVTYLDPMDREDLPTSRRSIAVREARYGDHTWTVGRSDHKSGDVSKVLAADHAEAVEAIREWMDTHPCSQRSLVSYGAADE